MKYRELLSGHDRCDERFQSANRAEATKRNIVLPVLLVVGVVACADHPLVTDPGIPFSPAVSVNERIAIFFGAVNPCNGEELLSPQGDIHIVISNTTDRSGGIHVGVLNESHFSA